MNAVIVAAMMPLLATATPFTALTGDTSVDAVVGNGTLTAGFTRHGQLALLRWPSPSYNDHLDNRAVPGESPRGDEGGMWGVEIDGVFQWIQQSPELEPRPSDSLEGIHRQTFVDASREVAYTLESFVADEPGVLVIRLTVSATVQRPRVIWYANLAPCTRRIPGLPIADWLLERQNDFAAFAVDQGKTIVQFRPADPGEEEWSRANRLASESRTTEGWSSFGPGVYIASAIEQPVVGVHCGRARSLASAYEAARTGRLQGPLAVAGASDVAVEVIPEPEQGRYAATVFVAIASSFSEAMDQVGGARALGFSRLRAGASARWQARLDAAHWPEQFSGPLTETCRRALQTILVCTDPQTGAVVRNPATQPPHALVWPRYAAWISRALDGAGLTREAEAHLEALIRSIRAEPGTSMLGSMPAAIYADGVAGLPSYINDIEGSGWVLWAVLDHALQLPADTRRAWIQRVWPKLTLAADFLAGWADSRDGGALHSFDWNRLHDAQRPRSAMVAFLGVDAAVRLASQVDAEVPLAWIRRRNELDLWIQLHHLQRGGEWELDDEAVFWLTELARTHLPPSLTTAMTASRPMLEASDPRWLLRARALSAHAHTPLQWRDAAWLASGFNEEVVNERHLLDVPVPICDAVDAAHYILAALATAGIVPAPSVGDGP